MGYIEGQDRNQMILFPESIDDYITSDNIVRVIDEFVNLLDLIKLSFKHATAPTIGRPPYNPKDLLKLYLYGYLHRIRSSRRLEHESIRNIEVMWLLKKVQPDFKTIADFRKDNKAALKKVFREFNILCEEWDLFGKELVAVDGSKFRACNSKHNNFSNKKLDRHIKYIDEKIDSYMQELENSDQVESIDRKPDAKEIQDRIKELRSRKEQYEGYKKELEVTGESEISRTDPDARLMSSNNNGVDVSYNVQVTVDAKNKLVADFKVTNQANDIGQLDNMALRTKKLFGGAEFEVVADKGYYKAEDLKKCVEKGISPFVCKQTYSNGTGNPDYYSDKFQYRKEKNVYICPMGAELSFYRNRKTKKDGIIGSDYSNYEACKSCLNKDLCTKSKNGRTVFRHKDQDFLDGIESKTQANIKKYRLRQMIVEHPFGTIKRGWGYNYLLTKGKRSVTSEMALSFLSYNLKRVINILGIKEILKKLMVKRELVMGI